MLNCQSMSDKNVCQLCHHFGSPSCHITFFTQKFGNRYIESDLSLHIKRSHAFSEDNK